MKIVDQLGGLEHVADHSRQSAQSQPSVTAMQTTVQSDQFPDCGTGHERYVLQIEHQPAAARPLDDLIQLDTELVDIVLFAKTRLGHGRDDDRCPIFDGEIGRFEFLE